MYPMIGVCGNINQEEDRYNVARAYMRALHSSGAIPVLLSYDLDGDAFESCLDRLDGILLSGGNDVNPAVYGQEPVQALGEVSPLRDAFELGIIRAALRRRMPVLGICRGAQILNAALGGTLWQDIPGQFDSVEHLQHSQTARGCYPTHGVDIVEGTKLRKIEKDACIRVNSFHHEAVRDVAPGMIASAYAKDGLIEAIEHPEYPFVLGVQWHPEIYFDRDSCAGALFDHFVQAAVSYAREK